MLLIKTYLSTSKIDGIGLFAEENVGKGEKIYQPSPGLDVSLSQEEFDELNSKDKIVFEHYGYESKLDGKYYLAFDDIRFCNHSKNPNISMAGTDYIALRNIIKGEELVCDYSEFEKLREGVK